MIDDDATRAAAEKIVELGQRGVETASSGADGLKDSQPAGFPPQLGAAEHFPAAKLIDDGGSGHPLLRVGSPASPQASRFPHVNERLIEHAAKQLGSVYEARSCAASYEARMKLQAELRHKSEEIDNDVLLDVVKAIRRRVRVINRSYDIPYIAGYSEDGHTVFIDRHLPRSFLWLMKAVRVEPFLLTHEIVEKALLDELRLHYLHAHQIAVRAERDAVKAAGVSSLAHQSFMKKHEREIEERPCEGAGKS
jgi:hypothetical protein